MSRSAHLWSKIALDRVLYQGSLENIMNINIYSLILAICHACRKLRQFALGMAEICFYEGIPGNRSAVAPLDA